MQAHTRASTPSAACRARARRAWGQKQHEAFEITLTALAEQVHAEYKVLQLAVLNTRGDVLGTAPLKPEPPTARAARSQQPPQQPQHYVAAPITFTTRLLRHPGGLYEQKVRRPRHAGSARAHMRRRTQCGPTP